MKHAERRMDMAVRMCVAQGIEFAEALEQANKLNKDATEYMESKIPEVGEKAVCTDNDPRDSGYTNCEQLELGDEYMVLKQEGSRIFVEDCTTGKKFGVPFYMDRFEKVAE